MRLFQYFRRKSSVTLDNSSGVMAIDEFRKAKERERLRSDRTGHPFAIVTFHSTLDAADSLDLQKLAASLSGCIRALDQLGWSDDGALAVLLAETSYSGAMRFVNKVGDVHPEARTCQPSIYIYPMDSEGFGDCDQRQSAERKPTQAGNAIPMPVLFTRPMTPTKRAIDIVGALTGLLVTWPIMLCAALAIKLTSPGPVLFKQQRSGLGGRGFTMYKLRTMHVGADQQQAALRDLSEQDGPAFKLTNDPRMTRVGRLLRKTSIDELPQFLNVLKGDMSLVGPRPLPCGESAACAIWQKRRLDVVPGLTCIWQVTGRSSVKFDDWIRMDLEYIRKQSLLYDLWLLLRTPPAVLLRRGAC